MLAEAWREGPGIMRRLMSDIQETTGHTHNPLVRYFRLLGPGLVTGASDDDPSGITTYSVAGASLGYGMLWTALATLPLMAAVQLICARIGLVTGRGLAGVIRRHYPRPFLYTACLLLLVANVFNIAADLAGMADAARLITGVPSLVSVPVFGLAILLVTVYSTYARFAQYLKWLTGVLFAYIVAAFLAKPDWRQVAVATVVPSLRWDALYVTTLVAVLGTTISPYLFFWQASQEVEEEKARGRHTLIERRGAAPDELLDRKIDIGVGTFFSNVVMFFIILTTAFTLHVHGVTEVTTSRQVAEALRPLAGNLATLLYTFGIVGTGLLAIPTLSCSAAYAFAELFGWREGIDAHFRGAPAFYMVVGTAMVAGVAMDFANVNAVKALYWTAVINGLLAPFLLTGILLVASDRKLMQNQPSSRLGRVAVGLTTAFMFVAAVAMFVV